MGTKIFSYAHIVAHSKMLAIADICPLLHIHRRTTFHKQMLGTTVT